MSDDDKDLDDYLSKLRNACRRISNFFSTGNRGFTFKPVLTLEHELGMSADEIDAAYAAVWIILASALDNEHAPNDFVTNDEAARELSAPILRAIIDKKSVGDQLNFLGIILYHVFGGAMYMITCRIKGIAESANPPLEVGEIPIDTMIIAMINLLEFYATSSHSDEV